MENLISIHDLSVEDIKQIFKTTAELKEKLKNGEEFLPLKGKSLAMIFEKPSTRTRVSFEVGMFQLGGHALYLNSNDIQLRRGESIGDTAKTLSRYVDAIIIRTFAHNNVIDLAYQADVPVINALSDLLHPCQALADYYTVFENRGKLQGLKIAYVGDGNNVAHSLMYGAVKIGMDISLACPKGYFPNEHIVEKAIEDANHSKSKIEITEDPYAAVANADVIYTDVWASMGQEKESEQRKKIFQPYQINQKLVEASKKSDVLVMHCLPAHRGDEITDEVIDGPNSVVFDEAENRLHVQKAILYLLITENLKKKNSNKQC
ncbi:MAG TPA: ornithine carbamoyltransferase [bacterium]|nr:ornithine carbamoyltransferase [bacterium]